MRQRNNKKLKGGEDATEESFSWQGLVGRKSQKGEVKRGSNILIIQSREGGSQSSFAQEFELAKI